MKKSVYILLSAAVLLALFGCGRRVARGGDETVRANVKADSLVILYERFSKLILYDDVVNYREFTEMPLQTMRIDNPSVIAFLDSCIDNAVPNTEIRPTRYSNYVATYFLLLRYHKDIIDSIALPCLPGLMQIRDTVFFDSLVYRATLKEIATRDSFWLKESILGNVITPSI